MSRQIMRQALEFCQYAWQDIQMDEYAFEQLEKTISALEAELAQPVNEFHPDWDTLKPYHDRIAELEAQLAKPEYSDLRKAAEIAMKWMEATHHTAMTTYSDEAYKEHCEVEKELRQALAQPEQEPVAWYAQDNLEINDEIEVIWSSEMPTYAEVWVPLYTAPQKPDVTLTDEGKTWQGLTDEEREAIILESYRKYNDGDADFVAVEIENKLREKNG